MNTSSLRIPLPSEIESSYVVFVKLSGAHDDLGKFGITWASRLCDEQLRTDVREALEAGRMAVRANPRESFPAPPIQWLRETGMGPEEERRYREATHVVLVTARSPFPILPWCVLVTLAMARGLATSLDGVALEPEVPRLLPVSSLDKPLHAKGSWAVANHIICPVSSDGGAAWVTTTGMKRFGLPNFEMRNVPPDLAKEVALILMTVAQVVIIAALVQASESNETDATEVVLDAEVPITPEDMAVAFDKKDNPTFNAYAGRTTVRLSFDGKGRREGMDPLIEVGPPASYTGTPGQWYRAMLEEFTAKSASGAPSTLAHAEALGSSSEGVAQAPGGHPFARFLSWTRRWRWVLIGLIALSSVLRGALRSFAPESAPPPPSSEGSSSINYLEIAGILAFSAIVIVLVRRYARKAQLQ